MSDSQPSEQRNPTFEETYPRYEFSELVRITLAIADWMARRSRPPAGRATAAPEPARRAGPTAPAT